MLVATIDIGTNTVLLLVAERSRDGCLRTVAERARITRLGEGVDRTRQLATSAIQRTRACLEEYATAVRDLGVQRIAVVGTSAMRDASGSDIVQTMIRELFGVEARIIGGQEEARLAFIGALSGLSSRERDAAAIFDVGGGSTEVVFGRSDKDGAHLDFVGSYDVGSVRMTERWIRHDPPTAEELLAILGQGRETFNSVPQLPSTCEIPVGVAGTITTLAAVSLGLATFNGSRVHGRVLPIAEIRRVVNDLASVEAETRKHRPGLDPLRADVIVAGGCVILALLEHWGASHIRVSDRGVRWGLAEELCP